MRKWVLPEYIDDILPAEAERIEALRRTLLDHFRDHGYRLVQPPLVEHLDSHLLNESGVTRLCYAGSVLRTVASGLSQMREVLQIGAELYGDPSVAADQEVLGLLLSSLNAVAVRRLHLDLGH